MRRRSGRSTLRSAVARSTPPKRIEPEVGFWMRVISRAMVDFPEPDSPTRPTVWPRRMSRSMPSTACTTRRGWKKESPLNG